MASNRKQPEPAPTQQAQAAQPAHEVAVADPDRANRSTTAPPAQSRGGDIEARVSHAPAAPDVHDVRTLRALQALTDAALSRLSLDVLLPELLECVRTGMQVDDIAILLLDEATQELEVRAARGLEEALVGVFRIPVGVGFAGRIAASRLPIAAEDLSTYPVSNPLLSERLRSALGVPLLAGDRVVGVLYIGSGAPRQFTADEESLLTQMANRIALAVERAQLYAAAEAARALAEQRAAFLRGSLEALGDGFVIADANGRLLYANPAYSAMLGVATPRATGDGVGAAASPPSPPSPLSQAQSQMQALDVRDAQGAPIGVEDLVASRVLRGETLSGPTSAYVRMGRANGSEAFLNVSGAPLRDDAGAIVGSVCLYRDVTDGWQLSETLRHSAKDLEVANTQLRTLLDVTPVGVSIVDITGKPQLVNDTVRQIWGQNLVIAESAAEYGEYRAWRSDTGERVAADEWGLARALGVGTVSVGMEYDIETFDGQRKTILDSAAPLRDAFGAITGAVSVIYDITERREYERRTRAALDAVLQMTQTLVALPDESGAATGRSDAAAPTHVAQTGAPMNDMANATAIDATHDAMLAEAARVTTGAMMQSAAPGPDSEATTAERLVAQRLAELTAGVLGCKRVGITAIEPETERLRAVAVVGLAPEQEPQWWAEQRELEAKGARFGDGGDPAELARFRAGEVFVIDMTQPPLNELPNPYGVTTTLIAPMRAGERLVGMLSLDFGGPPHAFTDEERALAGAVAQVGAVALERDRLLREREAARAEALALTEAKRRMDEFLGIASHELRTPITTVKANLQLAQRRARQALAAQALAAEPEATRAQALEKGPLGQLSLLLGRAVQSAERQERLVEDLLDISRISAGRLEYRMEPIDLGALTSETVDEQRLHNPARRIDIELEEPPIGTNPVLVVADADRVRQALTNYLTNALKYSEADRPVVVSLRITGGAARVEVHDQGQGLSAEHQLRMFERFYRAPGIEVMSGTGVGLGLGLYITKTVIEQHGGQLGVESAPGVGSTFWFTLPLAPVTTPITSE